MRGNSQLTFRFMGRENPSLGEGEGGRWKVVLYPERPGEKSWGKNVFATGGI